MRRRPVLALIALVTVGVALASTGSGAMAFDPGPLGAQPDPVAFNTEAVGVTTPARTVTFSNDTGTVDIGIQSVQASADYSVDSDHCTGQTLTQGGGSCSVTVTFTPGSAGPDNGTLTVNDDDTTDGVTSQSLNLTGTGVAAQFSVTGGPLAFGDQQVGTTSAAQSLLLTNNTDYAANPPNPSVTGANANDFNAAGCTGTVAANGSCAVTVDFTPGATGNRSATLNVAGQQVSLTGNGTDPAANVSPGTIDFGNQPLHVLSQTQTITLQDAGTAPLTYGSVGVTGADPGDFSVSDTSCAAVGTLAPGDTCSITVAFNPTATGARSAVVSVNDNDPGNGTQTVSVSGTGTPSSMGFSPSSVTFVNPIPAGTASPAHVVTVRNLTSSPMPITGTALGGANPKNFARSADACTGTTLQPNATCTVHVRFTPSAVGRRTAVLSVRDTGTVAPHTHQVTLTGRATAPNNPKNVRGTVGCRSSTITWVSPTATRFASTVVVRNHTRYPRNPGDGTVVVHGAGVAHDRGLKHFTSYYYRVFAKYHSLTHAGQVNYSKGVRLREHTGEICTPQNGARMRNLRPKFTWLRHPTQNGYAFVLQRGKQTIWINYTRKTAWQMPSSWRYRRSTHHLARGRSYTFYLYAYPASHPKGIFIGKTTFSER
jgi:hypothetical protein